jgi:uncharacterized protein YndB with AHSA1/START domain
MNNAAPKPASQDIVVDEVFPHPPETIWKALTTGDLIARWLMPLEGFAAVTGTRFTFQTKPGGHWDGTIQCEVLEVIPNQRLVYAWKGGDARNVGYGAPLDTVVSWTLSRVATGTRVRLVHAGFVSPRNDTAFQTMSNGWKTVVARINAMLEDEGEKS